MSLISKLRTKDSFFDDKLAKKKEGTRKQYKYALRDFEIFMKQKHNLNLEQSISELKNSKVEEVIDLLQSWINQSKIELRNQKFRLSLLNNYFYYRGLKIDSRDIKDLEFENKATEERRPVTKTELMQIIGNTRIFSDPKKNTRKPLYLALLSSGMAIGEACHIKKSDLDIKGERVKIVIKHEYTKRSSRGRSVYISKETWPALKPIYDMKDQDDFIFHNSHSVKAAVANEQMRITENANSLNLGDKYDSGTARITLHAFRAFYATKAIQVNGENYQHKMLGHKGHLMEYDRYTDEKKLELYLKMEGELLIYEEKPQDREVTSLREELKKDRDRIQALEGLKDEVKNSSIEMMGKLSPKQYKKFRVALDEALKSYKK